MLGGMSETSPPTAARNVLVAGAGGYLGRHLVTELARGGHSVRCLVRRPEELARPGRSGAPSLAGLDLDVRSADVTDPSTLASIADGVDAVISTIGVTGHGGDPWRVDHAGNLALLDAALAADVRRVVFVNVLHAEQIPADLTRAKSAFAATLRRTTDQHLIVNPSGYFSDLGAYASMARRGVALVVGGGRARLSPIDGADLAAVIRQQLEAGTTGDLDVGGPQTLTHHEIAELAFEARGKRPRIASVPLPVARAGLAPVRMVAPSAAGIATFLLAGLAADSAAPQFGHRRIAEHFQQLAAADDGGRR
ncbi:SDR family oxidoreductase [Brachybacterium fresconis]